MSGQQYQQALQQVQGNFPQSVQQSPYVQPFQFSQVSSPWNALASQLKAMPNYNTPDYISQAVNKAFSQQKNVQSNQPYVGARVGGITDSR